MAKAKENLIRSGKEYGKGLENSPKAFDQLRAEQARERQLSKLVQFSTPTAPQMFGERRNPTPPTPEPAKKKNETAYKIGELAGVSHLLHAAGDRGCGGCS